MTETFQIRSGRMTFFHQLWGQMRRMSGLELGEERSWWPSKLCVLSVMVIAISNSTIPFLALGGGSGLLTNVASSNGRHLKSFL